jgi:hypothetical protein
LIVFVSGAVLVSKSRNSAATTLFGLIAGLGGLTIPTLSAVLSTGSQANTAAAQDGGPKVEAGEAEGQLRDFLLLLSQGSNRTDASVARRALEKISEAIDLKKISDATKPLAATVFLDLLDPGSKAIVAEHLLTNRNAGGPGPQLSERLFKSLASASLDGRASVQKTASLLEKALSDNPHERSVYEHLLKLIPDGKSGSIGELARYSKAALDALGADATNQDHETLLKDSLWLLIGKGPGESEISKAGLLSVWHAVENEAKRDPLSGDAFIRQVVKRFLAPGVMSSQKKGEIIAEAPARFVRSALPVIAGMPNAHSQSQLVVTLPREQRESCEKLIRLHEEVNKLKAALKITELPTDYDSVVGWARQEWPILHSAEDKPFFKLPGDDRRAESRGKLHYADLLQAIESPAIHQTRGGFQLSTPGEAARAVARAANREEIAARTNFTDLIEGRAAQELAVIERDYTTGKIGAGEFVLGLATITLKNPGTAAAKIAESELNPRLNNLGMGRLWEYVSGREEVSERWFRSLASDLPGILGGCGDDPALVELVRNLFKVLPAMSVGESSLLDQMSNVDCSRINREDYYLLAEVIKIFNLGEVKAKGPSASIIAALITPSTPDDLRGEALKILSDILASRDDLDREHIVSLLDSTLAELLKNGEVSRDRKIWESEIYRRVVTPNILDSAITALNSGQLGITKIIELFGWVPEGFDVQEQAHKIESKLFDLISKEEDTEVVSISAVATLVHLAKIGGLAGLSDKLMQRIANPKESNAAKSVYFSGLSKLPATEDIFRFVVEEAKRSSNSSQDPLAYRIHSALFYISGRLPEGLVISDSELQLFELIKGEKDTRGCDILAMRTLSLLYANGHLKDLPEKLIQRMSDSNISSMFKNIYLTGLEILPVTKESFEAVLEVAKSCEGDDKFELFSATAESLKIMASQEEIPPNLDLIGIEGKMMNLIAGNQRRLGAYESVMSALVGLNVKGHANDLAEEIKARLKDPERSELAKRVYLKGLIDSGVPVAGDTLEVLLRLAGSIADENPSELSVRVFESLNTILEKVSPGIDIRDSLISFVELGTEALRNGSPRSYPFDDVAAALVKVADSRSNIDDASLIVSTMIESIKGKGASRITDYVSPIRIYKEGGLTPQLLECYLNLIAESVGIPLNLESGPTKPGLLVDGGASRLAQEIKAKIDDWLKANDKLSREMRETMKREHAAIKDAIAREVDKGLDAESPSIKTLNEVLEALSKSLGSGH